jgi:hypothetical protein
MHANCQLNSYSSIRSGLSQCTWGLWVAMMLTLQRRSAHIPRFYLYFYRHPQLIHTIHSLLRCRTKGECVSCVVRNPTRTKPRSAEQNPATVAVGLGEKILPPLGIDPTRIVNLRQKRSVMFFFTTNYCERSNHANVQAPRNARVVNTRVRTRVTWDFTRRRW